MKRALSRDLQMPIFVKTGKRANEPLTYILAIGGGLTPNSESAPLLVPVGLQMGAPGLTFFFVDRLST